MEYQDKVTLLDDFLKWLEDNKIILSEYNKEVDEFNQATMGNKELVRKFVCYRCKIEIPPVENKPLRHVWKRVFRKSKGE